MMTNDDIVIDDLRRLAAQGLSRTIIAERLGVSLDCVTKALSETKFVGTRLVSALGYSKAWVKI